MNDMGLSRRAVMGGGVAMALGGWPLASALAQAAKADATAAQWPAVTALIDRYVGQRKLAGMVAALGWGEAAPGYIARGREGFDDPDRGGPASLYRAYSMTKPVTGMAAMILIDEGKLKLDQPLADFAPEFSTMQVAVDPAASLAARPTQTQITVRHLLTHTSGLGYAIVGGNKVADELKRLGLNPGVVSRLRIPGVNDHPPCPDADTFLKLAATVPLVAEPGTKWRYSMALDVLGIVIARASGKRNLGEFMAERLFGPLGMESTWFQVPASVRARMTTNYGFLAGFPVAIDRPRRSVFEGPLPFHFGGSGLVTSPSDFDRFLAMVVNGGVHQGKRVMSEAAVRLGTSNLLPAGADTKGTWVENYHFGAGGIVGKCADEGLYGWSGAAGTVGFAQTRLKLRTSLYTQYMPQDHFPILAEFPKAVAADLTMQGRAPA